MVIECSKFVIERSVVACDHNTFGLEEQYDKVTALVKKKKTNTCALAHRCGRHMEVGSFSEDLESHVGNVDVTLKCDGAP